jgi:probable rRNA maturation factor
VLDLTIDPQVRALAPWGRELLRQVSRMVIAAGRAEVAAAAVAASHRGASGASRGKRRAPGKDLAELEASLRLTDDEAIRELNREFRHKDKATDVLAFAQREGPPGAADAKVLGDIVISLPTARRQAKRKTPAGLLVEVRFLASHGLCHLLGYDHRDDDEEREMNARMARLLAQAVGRGPIRAA